MRTIGDPAQHRAVEAGGLWAHLVTDLADTIPDAHRQPTPSIARDDRRPPRQRRLPQRTHHPSPRTARRQPAHRHRTYRRRTPRPPHRRLVHRPAPQPRRPVTDDGRIPRRSPPTQPPSPDPPRRRRHPHRTTRHDQRRTHSTSATPSSPAPKTATSATTTGTSSATPQPAPSPPSTPTPTADHQITVNFDRHGPLTLPDEFLTRHIRAGLDGGLAPAYAITTHAAQGSTYRTGRMLTTDTSTREGVYVGLTRGTTDTRLYLVAADELADLANGRSDIGLPIIHDTRTALDALADHLNAPDQATVIAATDPDARIVHTLRTRTIDELREIAPGDLNARRALRHVADATALHTVQNPTDGIIERFGERPPADSPLRPAWDDAITKAVAHSVVFGDDHATPSAQRSSVGVTASVERLDTLRNAAGLQPQKPIFAVDEVADLAALLRVARSTLPLDDKLIARLSDHLETHVRRAVDSRPDYLIELLGQRPKDSDRRASQWDRAATTIERTRHRCGFTPDRGPFGEETPILRAIGRIDVNVADRIASERAVQLHVQTQMVDVPGRHR